MEINILIGIYGAGKSTILNNLSFIDIEKISLDELDKETRSSDKRIIIIHKLFQQFTKLNINYDTFRSDYLFTFNLQNKSLINTLSILYSKYTSNSNFIDETVKNQLRKNILIPSFLPFFFLYLTNKKLEKNLIIDSGAMHFLCMDTLFFEKLQKFFSKINLIYIDNPIEQVIINLFQKTKGYYSFMERCFKKEVFDKTKIIIGIEIPKNKKEATELIEKNENIKNFIKNYTTNILISSKKELEIFFENIKENSIIKKYKLEINIGESVENILNRLKNIINR